MPLIIIFGISLLILLVLLLSKWREEKVGRPTLLGTGISLLDPLAMKINSSVDFRWKQISQTVRYIFTIVIPNRSEEAFKEAKRAASAQYKKQKEILMGRRSLPAGNSASFFLKKMKEEQENSKTGKIEDYE